MNKFSLVFVMANKGGVRKTFLAIHLFRLLQHLFPDTPWKAVDADQTYSPLAKRLPSKDVVLLDIQPGQYEPGARLGIDQIVRLMEDRVSMVIDCGANSSVTIKYIFTEMLDLAGELTRLGGQAVFIIPTDGEEKSDFEANDDIVELSPYGPVFIAKCLPGQSITDIPVNIPASSPERTITIPAMEPALLMYYRAHRQPLDAIGRGEGSPPPPLELRYYARGVLRRVHSELEPIIALIRA